MSEESAILLHGEVGPLRHGELPKIFRRLGLMSGDIVMVHSRFFTLGRMAPSMGRRVLTGAFIDSLKRIVGVSGTLIFPTFTLAVFETGHFSVMDTESEMGILSEEARSREDSVRTHHPMYSTVTIGSHENIRGDISMETCFGKDSIFDLLHEMNRKGRTRNRVKFLTIGVEPPPEALTYAHYIEEKMKVPYRYHKKFSGKVDTGDRVVPYVVQGFVRDISTRVVFDKDACWHRLKGRDGVTVQRVGDSIACLLSENVLYDTVAGAIEERSDFLCKGGYTGGDGLMSNCVGYV